MIWVKKQSVTLLELLIGMVLLTGLLAILFGVYRQQQLTQIELSAVRNDGLSKNFVDQRLCQIFLSINRDFSLLPQNNGPPVLVFIFDGGLNLKAAFSGELQGLLAPSDQGDLYFLTCSKERGEAIRKELLIANIAKIEYSFFSVEDKKWHETWVSKKNELPAFCSVKIWRRGEDKTPYFDRVYTLPRAQPPVIYPERV